MVNSPSIAVVQANDTESKRRKQTLERARANHLSRQLQMRLQYARLKVDHGWQKQSLNEVENLYFHHSHMRGPRPFPSASTLTTLTQPSIFQPTNTTRAHPTTQSSLSFKQHILSNRSAAGVEAPDGGAAGISITADGQLDEATGSQSQDTQTAHLPPTTNISPPIADPALLQSENSLISMDVEPDSKLTERMPSPFEDPFVLNTTLVTSSTTKPKSKSSSKLKAKSSRSPHSPSQGVSTLASNTSALSANPHTVHCNNNSQPNSIAYEFGNSTLTYDSFWSSHTTGSGSMSAQSYRSVFGVGGAAELETGRAGGG